jgi:pyruvate-formate lyase-activating enzyme
MTVVNTNFYCSQKFTFLSVDVEKRLMYSCCSATPEKIDLSWLKNNTGQLFNTPLLQVERQMMLDNIPVASCESNCWRPERENIVSKRVWSNTGIKTHTDVQTVSPTTLNIVLGSTCNLTCSYCCKQYSSAWRQDILKHGPYLDQDRFTLTNQDQVLLKISQTEHRESTAFQLIVDEVSNFDSLKTLVITGGEPLLYNGLIDLLNNFADVPEIIFYTGLGVNPVRLSDQLKKINNKENILVTVSGENCGKLYEFNRYNNTWQHFLTNLDILKTQGFNIKFSSVVSNLTVFGLLDFFDYFSSDEYTYNWCNDTYNWCNDPEFLAVNVIDDDSKDQLIKQFKNKDHPIRDQLISSLGTACTENQRQQFSIYLSEFAKRRNLAIDIFPESMLKWLKLQ